MPSVKIPKKSTDTDMTPFVDIAFLILSFFIMATKFKPQEPVEITTPGSVLSQQMPASNAVMILVDSANRVFFTVLSEKDKSVYASLIQSLNSSRGLNLTPAEMANFSRTYSIGVPFSGLKQLLSIPAEEQKNLISPVSPSWIQQVMNWSGGFQKLKRLFQDSDYNFLLKVMQNQSIRLLKLLLMH
jgi:biopolymer transport protein ExbD